MFLKLFEFLKQKLNTLSSPKEIPGLLLDCTTDKLTDDHFSLSKGSEDFVIKWSEVRSIIAYKEDKLSYDEICLDIICDNIEFTINEEMACWIPFSEILLEKFPSIPKDWFFAIMLPVFATNRTILYERN